MHPIVCQRLQLLSYHTNQPFFSYCVYHDYKTAGLAELFTGSEVSDRFPVSEALYIFACHSQRKHQRVARYVIVGASNVAILPPCINGIIVKSRLWMNVQSIEDRLVAIKFIGPPGQRIFGCLRPNGSCARCKPKATTRRNVSDGQ